MRFFWLGPLIERLSVKSRAVVSEKKVYLENKGSYPNPHPLHTTPLMNIFHRKMFLF